MLTKVNPKKKSKLINILFAGFITGTLDGLAAMILNYKVNPGLIFKFIASGAFGAPAFAGGAEIIVAGVIFHYVIAFLFSAVFFLLYPFFYNGLRNKYFIAVVYGVTAWLIMNLGVVPLSRITTKPGYHIPVSTALIGMLTLVVCVGLPVVFIADRENRKTA